MATLIGAPRGWTDRASDWTASPTLSKGLRDQVVTNGSSHASVVMCPKEGSSSIPARWCNHVKKALIDGEYTNETSVPPSMLVPLFIEGGELWVQVLSEQIEKNTDARALSLVLSKNSTERIKTALAISTSTSLEAEGDAKISLGYVGPDAGRMVARRRILAFLASQYYTAPACGVGTHYEFAFSKKDTRVQSTESKPELLRDVYWIISTGACFSCSNDEDLIPDIESKPRYRGTR